MQRIQCALVVLHARLDQVAVRLVHALRFSRDIKEFLPDHPKVVSAASHVRVEPFLHAVGSTVESEALKIGGSSVGKNAQLFDQFRFSVGKLGD